MPVTKIPLPFPVKGVNTVAPWTQMPAGTTPDSLNVWPISGDGRIRGGIRFGVKRLWTWVQWSNASPVVAMGLHAPLTNWFSVQLIVLTGNKMWRAISESDGTFTLPVEFVHSQPGWTTGATITSTSTTLGNKFFWVSSNRDGVCRYFDGASVKGLRGNETAGTAPEQSRLVASYRNRLILAGGSSNPYNFFASRVGDPLDWDYSKTDPAAAFAGNFTPTGGLTDRIEAIIPRDDYLIFACERSIYRMVGDIGFGGELELITDKIGIAGPRAWTTDPTGAIWFASRQGFFKMLANGAIENYSDGVLADVFEQLSSRYVHAQVAWDHQNKGCWIVFSSRDPSIVPPSAQSGASGSGDSGGSNAFTPDTVYWFDERTGGFFKMQFGNTTVNGIQINSVLMYDGVLPNDTQILFGAEDGRVYRFKRADEPAPYRDEVTDPNDITVMVNATYDAYVYLGPIQPAGPVDEAMCIGIDTILGYEQDSTTIDVDVTVQGGDYPWEAVNSPQQTAAFTYTTGGKQEPQSIRMSENAFAVKLERGSVTKGFSLEHVVLHFQTGGAERNVNL